ncbi:conserved hypothetical protein [Culex quinquefasciatus]|uniref:Uncharacterized protein n=1 Tax=Culex quinquefasciatus TaxID=7176 RepID=B0WNA2_CULQU|nr:conserved hypothetical protein [Culex quinquefasciatus]|eukprot:XP_001850185.1 conserved hypothetical protein [Culex quinquefasciatus]
MNRRWGKCGTQKAESAGNIFKDTLWKKEKELCEQWQHGRSTIDLDEADKSASVITAHWTSVRDTVRKIETLALTTVLAVSCGDLAGAGEDDRAPMEGKPKPSKKKKGLLQHQQYPETPLFNPNLHLFIRRRLTNGTSSSIIMRTVYRESIVSSTNLPRLDKQSDAGATGKCLKDQADDPCDGQYAENLATWLGHRYQLGTFTAMLVHRGGRVRPTTVGRTTCINGNSSSFPPVLWHLLKSIAAVQSSGVNESHPMSSVAGDRRNMCTRVKSGSRGDLFVCCNCCPRGVASACRSHLFTLNVRRNLDLIHIPGTPSSRQMLMPPNARSPEDLYIGSTLYIVRGGVPKVKTKEKMLRSLLSSGKKNKSREVMKSVGEAVGSI